MIEVQLSVKTGKTNGCVEKMVMRCWDKAEVRGHLQSEDLLRKRLAASLYERAVL